MKTTLAALLLLLALPLVAADKPASYAGKWSLDKARSTNLPPYYEEISSHELTITQDEKELIVTATITAAGREADDFDFRYRLDGTPVTTETKVRTPSGNRSVPTTLQAKPADGGGLAITIERELPSRDGATFKGTTHETWRLDAEGKTLTIDRVDESRRGTMEATMVFSRVGK
jgi:hypothetical protein